jgi:hypothetical protein
MRDSLGGATHSEHMQAPDPLILRVLFAIPGASALAASYSERQRRRRDPTASADPTADLLWRTLPWGLVIGLGIPFGLIVLHAQLPSWLLDSLIVLMISGILCVFVSAFALGWHQGGRR